MGSGCLRFSFIKSSLLYKKKKIQNNSFRSNQKTKSKSPLGIHSRHIHDKNGWAAADQKRYKFPKIKHISPEPTTVSPTLWFFLFTLFNTKDHSLKIPYLGEVGIRKQQQPQPEITDE